MSFQLLTKAEMQNMTKRKRRDCVVRWFREAGWIFELDANGWPIVSAAYAEGRLSGRTVAIGRVQPNFASINKAA